VKKLLVALLCVTSFTLFSCASKASPDNTNEISAPVIESEELPSDQKITDDESDESDNSDIIEENNLQEIKEPEITDLEPVEELETEENEIAEEPVSEEDISLDETEQADINDDDLNSDSLNDDSESDIETPENSDNESDSELKDDQDISSDDIQPSDDNFDETENEDILADSENVVENNDKTDSSDVDVDADNAENIDDDNIEISDEEESNSDNAEIEDTTPSRVITLNKNEFLDVTYPGKGWIFLGTTDNSKDKISYFGRKLGTENTTFTLQAKLPGTKILHFSKNDSLTNEIIDDYLEVTISSTKGDSKVHVSAPDFTMPVKTSNKTKVNYVKSTLTEDFNTSDDLNITIEDETSNDIDSKTDKIEENNISNNSNNQSEVSNTKSVNKKDKKTEIMPEKTETAIIAEDSYVENYDEPEVATLTVDFSKVLTKAKENYSAKNYHAALENINEYLEGATNNRDEALFILGQILEAQSESQNIVEAINAYTTLTKTYPASKYWDKANKRITYLKRFYLQGR